MADFKSNYFSREQIYYYAQIAPVIRNSDVSNIAIRLLISSFSNILAGFTLEKCL